MSELFENITKAIEGAPVIALTASFCWGALSVLLSPCHLASIPLIIGLVDNHQVSDRKTAFIQSSLFSIGILLSIAIIGVITAAVGTVVGNIGKTGSWIAAIIFLVMGLQMLGILSSPWKKPEHKKVFGTALLTGLVFGIALGPCTFAFMAPVLTATFALSAEAPVYAWSLVLAYGIGHCAVLIAAGTSAEVIRNYLNWNEHSKGAVRLRKICGVLIILAGLYLVKVAV